MYREIKPIHRLKDFVGSFWTYSGPGKAERYKVLPDGCIDLIFNLSDHTTTVSGIMTRFAERKLDKGTIDLIGIRFKTGRFKSLTTVPQREFKDLKVEADQMVPKLPIDIHDRLAEQVSNKAKIAVLQSAIHELVVDAKQYKDMLILSIVDKIRREGNTDRISSLAKSHGISLRQLERRFKASTGLTVKEFASIVRFNNARSLIRGCPEKSLLEIAFDLGFYDHAHLNNEFNRLSGENPSYFR